jgi:LysR family transcriptional regulator, glycine cleavage system transcriptional activator
MQRYRLPMLNLLLSFEAAARHQSIKKACHELHVTPTAVTRRIQKLERDLDRSLFKRHNRRIVLTDDGEMLLGSVTTALSLIQRAVMQLRGKQTPERLVISVDPDFAGLWLVPRLAELYNILPNTIVEIIAEKAPLSPTDPRVHCAVQYAKAGIKFENGEMLFRSRLFPVCAESLTRTLPLKSPSDLRHHALLHDRSIDEWEHYLRSCAVTSDVNVRAGIVFSENALCLDAAARGQGVAIGDDFLAAVHLAEGRLIRPFGSTLLSGNAYYFVAADSASRHPSVAAFRAWLLQSVRRRREELGMPD